MQLGRNKFMGAATNKNTIFKHFTAIEIEHIFMRLRIVLGQYRKIIDSQLKHYIKLLYTSDAITDQYINLQQICKRLIEIKANKTTIQYVDRLISNKNIIAQADGTITNIQEQALLIQALSWYINIKKLSNGGEFISFCMQYFKGIDIVQDTNLQNRLCCQLKNSKLKLEQIKFSEAKQWLDFVIQQFSKPILAELTQLNQLFVGNNFNNQQIKQYFHTKYTPTLQQTRSNMYNQSYQTNSPLNSKSFSNDYQNQRHTSSEVKQFKNQNHMNRTRDDVEITVEQKYSLLIIKQALEMFKLETNYNNPVFSIKVQPFDQNQQ